MTLKSEAVTLDAQERAPLLHHMRELFVSLRFALLFLFIGLGVAYGFSSDLLNWLKQPFLRVMGSGSALIYLSPFEKIWVHLKLSLAFGVFVSLPFIYGAIFYFVRPALKKAEIPKLHVSVLLFFLIFYVGLYIGQSFVAPLLLERLIAFKEAGEQPFFALMPYTNTLLGVLIATALLLELPFLMLKLSYLGWVRAQMWRQGRRLSIVVNAAVSAFLSPPDLISMFLIMLPMQILYEAGILLARMAELGRNEKKTY